MKKIFKILKIRHFVLLLVLLFVLISSSIVSYAAYTHSLHAQRTIAPYEINDSFSSNYLLDNSDNTRVILTSNENDVTILVTICNYPQGKPMQYYDDNITYTLSLVFNVGTAENDTYVVEAKKENNNEIKRLGLGSVTIENETVSLSNTNSFINQTISGTEANIDIYKITFSSSFVNRGCNVLVVADPNNNDLHTLYATFRIETQTSISNDWRGDYAEYNINTPNSYDGFNYIITGKGSGSLKLEWKKSDVNISKVSLDLLLSITGATYSEQDGKARIVFNVDSDVQDRYELQFYKIGHTNVIYNNHTWQNITWEEMNNVIKVVFPNS